MTRHLIFCGLMILAAAACSPSGTGGGATSSAAVQLGAQASKSEYAVGEPVRITLQLQNLRTNAVKLSQMAEGNIHLISFKKDGVDLAGQSRTLKYDAPLAQAIQQMLKTIQPNEKLTIDWDSIADTGTKGTTLEVVSATPDPSPVISYPLDKPGHYELVFTYLYGGPKDNDPQLYTDETNQVSVTFTVK